MKLLKIIPLFLVVLSFQLRAQPTGAIDKSLVGTWKETRDSIEEIKIISPTHVFFFVHYLKPDTFAHAGAGTYTVSGDKYTENMQYADFDFGDAGNTYTYKVEGDKFYQKGVLTFKSGRQVSIDHVFTRVKSDKAFNGPHVGTWNQISSSFTMANGQKGTHTNATHIRYQVITPTHWMRISYANGKFENVFGGTYTLNGNEMNSSIDFSSLPFFGGTTAIKQRQEGDKMYWSGVAKDRNGGLIVQFDDVFERVTGQTKSTAGK